MTLDHLGVGHPIPCPCCQGYVGLGSSIQFVQMDECEMVVCAECGKTTAGEILTHKRDFTVAQMRKIAQSQAREGALV